MSGKTLSNGHGVGVVFKKEIKDGLRDWRSILAALIYPIMGPLLIVLVFSLVSDVSKEPETVTLPVVGAENAPELVAWLEQNGVKTVEAPANPKEEVRKSSIDMALRIPNDYAQKMAQGRPIDLQLMVDSGSRKQASAKEKVTRLINEHATQIGSLRLLARGIHPKIASPLHVKNIDVANKKASVANVLNMVPLWIMIAAFVCGMMLAMDTTAGERERGSMESLLLCPVKRRSIVLGKWLATSVFSGVGLTLTLLGMIVVVGYLPLEEIGFRFSFDAPIVMGLFAAMLPLALMATALMLLIATFARSYKEASISLQFLLFLPMVPTFLFIDATGSNPPWMYAVPILAQDRLMSDVLFGDPPKLATFAIAGLVSLAIAVLTIWLTTRLFQKEKIIFGR